MNFDYNLPELRKWKDGRWYIEWREIGENGELKRFRKTFKLNTIKNPNHKRKKARVIINLISESLFKYGTYINRSAAPTPTTTLKNETTNIPQNITPIITTDHKEKEEAEQYVTLLDVLNKGLTSLLKGKQGETVNAYNSLYNVIVNSFNSLYQLKKAKNKKTNINYLESSIKLFDVQAAQEWINHLRDELCWSGQTVYNRQSFIRSCFKEAIRYRLITESPFDFIKFTKGHQVTKRKEVPPELQEKLLNYFKSIDIQFYKSVLILFYGLIRPREMWRMTISYINWDKGLILLPGMDNREGTLTRITKNKKDRTVTLPKFVLQELEKDWKDKPGHFYCFGRKGKGPAADPVGKNWGNYRHNKYIKQAIQKNIITEAEAVDITFYSWKNAGVGAMADYVSLPELVSQAGHQDPKVTMIYYTKYKGSEKIKNLNLFDKE